MCSCRTEYRFLKTNTIFFLFSKDIFKQIFIRSLFSFCVNVVNKYLILWLTFLVFEYGEGHGDGYLESDYCRKSPYHIQSLCPHGQVGEGVSQMWTGVDKGESGVKNHWKCADILYGLSTIWQHTLRQEIFAAFWFHRFF